MEYQTQQLKLFPALSHCFGFQFASQFLWDCYHVNQEVTDNFETSSP
jgi:hypothetical protein